MSSPKYKKIINSIMRNEQIHNMHKDADFKISISWGKISIWWGDFSICWGKISIPWGGLISRSASSTYLTKAEAPLVL